jgi:hypothetical protein
MDKKAKKKRLADALKHLRDLEAKEQEYHRSHQGWNLRVMERDPAFRRLQRQLEGAERVYNQLKCQK